MTTPSSSQTNGYHPPPRPTALAAAVVANPKKYDRPKKRRAAKLADLETRLRMIRAMGPAVAKGRQKGHTRKIYRLTKPGIFRPKEFTQ